MSALSFAELRTTNVARQGAAGWNHPIAGWSIDDWFIALAGEVGETLNVVKKLNRERDGLIGNSKAADDLRQDLADELADAVLYLDLLLARADTGFEAQGGDRSFIGLRNYTAAYPTEETPSGIGRNIIRSLAFLSETLRGSKLLRNLDELAYAFDIDLGDAVVSKFNRTSEKHGMPHRLPGGAN